MKTNLIQQTEVGFKTVSVHGGPMTVRVHEGLDVALQCTSSRYFISVDFKFKSIDAMNIGNPGYYGDTRAGAERTARELAEKIALQCEIVNSCESKTGFQNAITLKLQTDLLNKLVGKYTAEFI